VAPPPPAAAPSFKRDASFSATFKSTRKL